MKILVVDRAEDLRAVLDILEKIPGNEIQSATTGEGALELTREQPLDLLITEVFLEPMNGFTLRNKMENRHAGVRTIFISGYDLTPYAEHTAGYEIISKPATPQKLFPAIARATNLAPTPAPASGVATQLPLSAPYFAAPPPTSPPGAVPKSRQAGAPTARPAAVPKAAPAPTARPAAVPTASPAPTARRPAAPTARPAAVPKAATAPTAQAAAVAPGGAPATEAAPDPLLGKTLGSYRIERRLGNGKWGAVYMAIQTSMNRPVAMEVLSAEAAGDESIRQKFVASARAKAGVQHPHILSVYEADQAAGQYFYTHEYVDGLTLAQLVARGEGLSEPMALQTIKCVAQGLSHLHQHEIAHSIPDAADIYVGVDGLPYLSNVAQPTEGLPTPVAEIRALGGVIRSVLPGGQAQERGLQAMIIRMCMTTSAGIQSWPVLFQAIQAIEPKIIPADAFKLSAQDQEAIRAVEAARKRQKLQVMLSVAGLIVFLGVAGFLFWFEFMRPETHDYSNDMVEIPAGSFIYQDGQTRTLPTFYIDKYEVTMAEYAKFLDYWLSHGKPTDFDSPLQPKEMDHVPDHWNIYYGRASSSFKGYRTVSGVPISLDCPVFNVNYFDAYAYAKWKGRRLPKEEEWEKAARGMSGYLYPWGNEWDPKKLNAGGDYQAAPPLNYKPGVDGYNWWAPVDAFPTDRSPYGVIGMAGNVSEWTDSWDPSKTFVIIRGGNYKSNATQALATSSIKVYPLQIAETLGFRTISDKPPGK